MNPLEPAKGIPPTDVRLKPIWYQVMYNLAAHEAHVALGPHDADSTPILGRGAPTFFDDALASASNLLAASSTTLLDIAGGTLRPRWWERKLQQPREQLRTFLDETMEPASALLVAGLLDARPDEDPSSEEEVARWLQPRNVESRERGGRRIERQAIPEIAGSILTDEADTELSEELARFAVERPRLSYRVLYNRACYLSGRLRGIRHVVSPRREIEENVVERVKGIADEALDALGNALQKAPPSERRSLAHWAPRDPSLAELRSLNEREFKQLLLIYEDPSLQPRRQKAQAASS